MKRSEALNIITEIVSEVTYENLAEKRAERILAALEKSGMLPPSFHLENEGWSYYIDGETPWELENG